MTLLRINQLFSSIVCFSLVGLAACSGADQATSGEAIGSSQEDVKWGSKDRPAIFNENLEYQLDKLPSSGEAAQVPWAGNYWPTYQDSINHPWDGKDSDSPAKKYEKAFNGNNVEDSVSRAFGIDSRTTAKVCKEDSECNKDLGEACSKRIGKEEGKCIPTWFGICHAWSPAAILEPEPKHPVTHNGVTFKVNDLKALISLTYDKTETKFISLRCNKNNGKNEIEYDEYGRPIPRDESCQDTNPGTFHVIVSNYLGILKKAFVEDRTFDFEVWNQPVRAFNVGKLEEVTAKRANQLIGVVQGATKTEQSGAVAKDKWVNLGPYEVTPGSVVRVDMTGTNDADLFVRFGAKPKAGEPSATTNDCRPYLEGSNESCDLIVPEGQHEVYIGVRGYEPTSDYKLAISYGGTTPDAYTFNPDASRFYYVETELSYISESAANQDGNLSSQIDHYTHKDNYNYVLELDVNGKIIGGEWVGASKKAHPDFLWLPTKVGSTSVAGGAITYEQVKMLINMSVSDPSTSTPAVAKKVNDSVAKSAWKHYGPFTAASASGLNVVLSGTGDADLYVRKAAQPTDALYDCRPWKDGSNETCAVAGEGSYYVSVFGYTASTFELNISGIASADSAPTPEPQPVPASGLNESGSVALSEFRIFTLPVTAGRPVTLATTAAHDIDLYVRLNSNPTTNVHDGVAYTESGNESLTYTPTADGVLHVGVFGYEASDFTLTATQ
jgi:uncharacterized protein YuzE